MTDSLDNYPVAFHDLSHGIREDYDLAWAWHCNIAMAYYDAGGDPAVGNKGAARFMAMCFGVDTSTFREYLELPCFDIPV